MLTGVEEGVNEDLKESKGNVIGRQRKEDLVSWQMLQQRDLQSVFNELMDLAKEILRQNVESVNCFLFDF